MGLLCFIHMPRTGGRSIRKQLEFTPAEAEAVHAANAVDLALCERAARILSLAAA